MDVTLMLAGGYFGVSEKLYKQVDPDLDRDSRGCDYVLRVKGLPETYLPAEKKKIIKYHCETCGTTVPEWEVEQKVGCFQNHHCKQVISYVDEYPGYVYQPVNTELAKKKKFLKDGKIIWVNNPEGYKIVEKIFKYIQSRLPVTEIMPSPVLLGTKSGFIIEDVEEIPLVDVTTAEVKKEVALKKNMQLCPHCDTEVGIDPRALRMHIMQKHKDIFAKMQKERAEQAEQATPA